MAASSPSSVRSTMRFIKGPTGSAAEPQAVGDLVLNWAAANGRQPPWRESPDPYRLATAGILLQKTKAEDARHIWEQLIEQYPHACALAQAPGGAVEHLVAPLGLRTQRTQRLQAMAHALCQPHPSGGGKVPGLGPYGSAILCLSTGQPLTSSPVDGNIARVITRLYGLSFTRGEARKKPEVKNAVDSILSVQPRPDRALETVYALVDLGAAICTPHKPNCAACPLSELCTFASGSG